MIIVGISYLTHTMLCFHAMNNCSICQDMKEIAKLVPCGVNAKLVLRHSIRGTLKGVDFPDEVSLTTEGIKKAVEFGKNLHFSIGDIFSSNVLRCVQTVKCIIEGAAGLTEYPISLVDMRQFYSNDNEQSFRTFISEKSGKNVVVKLSNGITLPGFYSIREIALNQLNFIFGTGGKPSCLDIYCTHDFQLICLISALFKNVDNIEDVQSNWPNMLEGVFVWGTIDNFHCIWRDNICHIENLNF